MPHPLTIVVMGVAGCGKTTIGQLLAARLAVPYAEADTFHPPANVAKMAQGVPLDDGDRGPWLAAIADRIARAGPNGGVVVSCSALKRRYRDRLRAADPGAGFVHLAVEPSTVVRRVAGRADHFMPASLVDSQFQTLEPLQPDERGVVVDASRPADQIVDAALVGLRRTAGPAARTAGPAARAKPATRPGRVAGQP